MEPTHAKLLIYLECKKCGHKNSKAFVLKLESTAHIGCDNCKFCTTKFTVRNFVSWSSSSDDVYVKVSVV